MLIVSETTFNRKGFPQEVGIAIHNREDYNEKLLAIFSAEGKQVDISSIESYDCNCTTHNTFRYDKGLIPDDYPEDPAFKDGRRYVLRRIY